MSSVCTISSLPQAHHSLRELNSHSILCVFQHLTICICRVYLEGLCTILYDTMRPFIIHINHLETLAEICSILRIEMLEEHVQQNRMLL